MTGPHAPAGLYIHVPFCVSLCPYCDFVVVAGKAARGPQNRIDSLLDALHAELDLRADAVEVREPLRSVYIGGGTPSLLAASPVASPGPVCDSRLRRRSPESGA